jgi:predicted HTH transcriptional regulator
MALMHIPLEQIEEKHLQSLTETGAAESLWIEYKRDTYGSNDDAKAEFLADVSSFANSSGGDLVIGMEAKKGVPIRVKPFTELADSELLWLNQMAQNGLQPRIAKLLTKAVQIASGGSVLIIRVPSSYSAPHRVILKNKNRFWARSGVGKYEPDVDQLREIFTRAPQLAERMREFRMERIARIAAGNTPVSLSGEACLVVHVIPFQHLIFVRRFRCKMLLKFG